jgi:hypothetical protein
MDFFPKSFCGVFELSLLGNAQKRDMKKSGEEGREKKDRTCVLSLASWRRYTSGVSLFYFLPPLVACRKAEEEEAAGQRPAAAWGLR